LRELYGTTSVHVFLCNWYGALKDLEQEIFEHPDDHAGEMETSFGLAYFPNLVGRKADGTLIADDGKTAKTRFEAVNRGWVSITRPWHLLTTNSGSGYPHAASAEKGHKLLEQVVKRLSPFLVELSAAKLDEKFPF
jgi:creatinine amidohydrolase